MLSKEQVQKIAHLARIKLTGEEEEKFISQLGQILDYFNTLREVDTSKSDYEYQVAELENVTRKDIVEECDKETRDKLVEEFPDKDGDLLKVPGIFNK